MHYHAALTYLVNYLSDNYMTIFTYLAAGGGISVVIQFLKKLRNWERSAWIQFVLGVFSIIAAAADYIINNYSSGSIPTIFGDMTPKLVVASMIMHRIAVSPLTKFIEKQVQGMVNRAATKAADIAHPITGQITPHATAPSPSDAEPVADVSPML